MHHLLKKRARSGTLCLLAEQQAGFVRFEWRE